jgi:DNA-binding beta-propeller fold protein YncE
VPEACATRAYHVRVLRASLVLILLAACGDDGGVRHLPDARPFNAPPGIYVTNETNLLLVFAIGASGDVAPIRTIEGAATGLSLPIGIDLDADGFLYIANRVGGTVTVYPKDGAGNLAPTRTLTVPSAQGLAITSTNELYVSACPSCGGASGGVVAVYHFADGASTSDYTIEGSATGFSNPSSLAIDKSTDELYVANSFGGNVSVWTHGQRDNVLPARSFDPASSNLQSMTYSNGTVFLTEPSAGIRMFDSQSTGTPTPIVMPFGSPLNVNYPGGLFLDPNGQPVIYLADYSGDAIHIIQTAGTAPNLTVASVTTIEGPATRLSGPLGIRVVP